MGRGPSIEARKNAVDAQRGKIFTKVIREIGVAARAGGGDPAANPRLRTAIDKGLAVNMSKDVIERAIKKATGELEGVEYEEIRYEGYAPGGVAVIVDCLTDNRVRTVADVRHAFGKFGGNLGTEGSVSFMFKKLGVLSFAPGADEDLQGRSFVGRSGRLLDRILASIGLDVDRDIYIASVLKCRPPDNRKPKREEAEACSPHLAKQFDIVKPEILVILGATALSRLLPDADFSQ